jgi:hypothetical protein
MMPRPAAFSRPAVSYPGKSGLVGGAFDDSFAGVDGSSNTADERDRRLSDRILKPRSAYKMRQRLRQMDQGLEWKLLALSSKPSP